MISKHFKYHFICFIALKQLFHGIEIKVSSLWNNSFKPVKQ